MKGQVNDGGPFSPSSEEVRKRDDRGIYVVSTIQHPGASLRAAAAIAAMPQAMLEARRDPREAARIALEHADALLEALDA